jgi:hypothetical protein
MEITIKDTNPIIVDQITKPQIVLNQPQNSQPTSQTSLPPIPETPKPQSDIKEPKRELNKDWLENQGLIRKHDAAEMRVQMHKQTIIRYLFLTIISLVGILLATQNIMFAFIIFVTSWVVMGFWVNVMLNDVQYLNTKYTLGLPTDMKNFIFKNMFSNIMGKK